MILFKWFKWSSIQLYISQGVITISFWGELQFVIHKRKFHSVCELFERNPSQRPEELRERNPL